MTNATLTDPGPAIHTKSSTNGGSRPAIPEQQFKRLTEKVLERKPILREIIRKHGSKGLYDYAKEYISVNLNPPIRKRQDELIGTIHDETQRLLGKDVAESVAKQLEHHYYVSTVDHQGPLCHPFFLSGNLITAAPYGEYRDPSLKNVIVLACANISLSNSSFPRGLFFNSMVGTNVRTHRLAFLPSTAHSSIVYNFRGYTMRDIEKIKSLLRDKEKAGEVHRREIDIIESLLQDVYSKPDVFHAESFSEQMTKTNFHFWKRFFGQHAASVPNLIYLEQESIVTQLLIKHHLHEDTIIRCMLLDPSYDSLILHYFEGIQGTFSRHNSHGSYLFWGITKDRNYRVQLWKKGNELASEDGSFRVPLTPEAVQAALENKEIIPSMMLIFTVLSFYYGLKCLGGFSQVNYLTMMKNAYIKMNADRGNYRSIEVCARAQTKELCELTMAFLGVSGGRLIPATGLDLVLYGDKNTWPCLIEQSKIISLEEALDSLMPEFYRVAYNDFEREEALAAVTAEDITRITKLDQKIKACATIQSV